MSKRKVYKSVEYLDWAANHFVHRDWDYTRTTHIESIRYDKEHDPLNKISKRIRFALMWLFKEPDFVKQLEENKNFFQRLRSKIGMAIFSLKRDNNIPDGVLNEGSVITFWEETGEYIQLVQPSVGALLANFLKEEPEHPHAKLITAELERITNRFNKRVKDGEVYGE